MSWSDNSKVMLDRHPNDDKSRFTPASNSIAVFCQMYYVVKIYDEAEREKKRHKNQSRSKDRSRLGGGGCQWYFRYALEFSKAQSFGPTQLLL